MENSKEAVIKLIFGMRGSGKTVKAKQLIKDVSRLIVIDTLCRDYSDGVVFRSISELKKFWRKVYLGDFRLIYKPQGGDDEKIEDIAEICRLCEKCEDLTLLIEELGIIFDSRRPPVEFNSMLFSGRHSNIELIGVSQRPYGFGRNLTSQAKEFYVFANREPDDINFFRRYLGKEAADAICKLEQYQYLKWVFANGSQGWEVCKDENM